MSKNEEQQASWPSRLIFMWVFPLLKKGTEIIIKDRHLLKLRDYEEYTQLEKDYTRLKKQLKSQNQQITIFDVIFTLAKTEITVVLILSSFFAVYSLIGPLCINKLIKYLNSDEDPIQGYIWVALIFIYSCSRSVVLANIFHVNDKISYKFLYIVEQQIIQKALKITSSAKRVIDSGKIISLLTSDANAIYFLCQDIVFCLGAPLQITIPLTLILLELGWAGLIGPIILIISLCLQGLLSKKNSKYQTKGLGYRDKRSKYIKEFFGGIKVIKYYAWEQIVDQKLTDIREEEGQIIFKILNIRSLLDSLYEITPILISAIVFSLYVSLGNQLDAATAFTVISLFMIFQQPVRELALTFQCYASASVSIKRINFFLEAEESNENFYDKTLQVQKGQIKLENCNFKWSSAQSVDFLEKSKKLGIFGEKRMSEKKQKKKLRSRKPSMRIKMEKLEKEKQLNLEYCFKNFNLNIQRGKLIGIVGETGSGKSALLSCILNDIYLEKGRINIEGVIAYVPQQAWLMNDTVRENILFGSQYDQARYREVLDICELESDLNLLPGGDMTEICEKGTNLSGGQKQRISIARALYQEADIYIFDDCLSALDMNVAQKIFQKAIQEYLQGKTRLLVTHALFLLDKFDELIIVKDLQIAERGSYTKLALGKKNKLSSLLPGIEEKDDIQEQDQEESISKDNVSQEIKEEEILLKPKETQNKYEGIKESDVENRRKTLLGQLISKELIVPGSVPFRVYGNYLFGNSALVSIFAVLFFIIAQIIRLLSDFWLAIWSSDYFKEQPSFYIQIYLGFSVITGLVVYLRGFAFAILVSKSSIRIYFKMLKSLLKSPLWWFDTTPLGRIINRCTKDQDDVDYQLPLQMILSFTTIFQAISTFIAVSIITPYFSIIFVLVFIGFCFVVKFFMKTSVEVRKILSQKRAPFYSQFAETINGISLIKVFGKEQLFLDQIRVKSDEYHRGLYNQNVVNCWLSFHCQILSSFLVGGTALFGVLSKGNTSINNPALIGLCLNWVLGVTIFLTYSIKLLVDQEIIMGGVQRILEYAEDNPQESEFSNPKAPLNWPSEGTIVAKDLVYKYRPELPVALKGVSFELKSCEKLGVCGRTGSGKSTLTLGLLRILEIFHDKIPVNCLSILSQQIQKEIEIKIVQENQKNKENIETEKKTPSRYIKFDGNIIDEYGLHEIRKRVTIIPQDPVLFSGTIRYNLDPLNEYSDKEVIIALQKAQIWDAIPHPSQQTTQLSTQQQQQQQQQQNIQNSYLMKSTDRQQTSTLQLTVQNLVSEEEDQKRLEYVIEEDGQNFSIGQKQLICLARAVLKKSKILLMDEATASIDEKTDQIVQSMIKTEFKNCTVITIAHRLNTIINYDRILVLKDGYVKEIDTPFNLINNPESEFYGMIAPQGPEFIEKMKSLIEVKSEKDTQENS